MDNMIQFGKNGLSMNSCKRLMMITLENKKNLTSNTLRDLLRCIRDSGEQ